MKRKEITAETVAEIERLLKAGFMPAEVACQLEVSSYIAEVIAHDDGNRNHPAPAPESPSRLIKFRAPIDIGTIRIIKRLLSVGILSYAEIGRDLGVSKSVVRDVAGGKRIAVVFTRPFLSPGEKFLSRPRRCGTCGANLVVSPCRACNLRHGK